MSGCTPACSHAKVSRSFRSRSLFHQISATDDIPYTISLPAAGIRDDRNACLRLPAPPVPESMPPVLRDVLPIAVGEATYLLLSILLRNENEETVQNSGQAMPNQNAMHSGHGVTHRHGVPCVPMITGTYRNKIILALLALCIPILHSHLQRHFHGHRAGVGIKIFCMRGGAIFNNSLPSSMAGSCVNPPNIT